MSRVLMTAACAAALLLIAGPCMALSGVQTEPRAVTDPDKAHSQLAPTSEPDQPHQMMAVNRGPTVVYDLTARAGEAQQRLRRSLLDMTDPRDNPFLAPR